MAVVKRDYVDIEPLRLAVVMTVSKEVVAEVKVDILGGALGHKILRAVVDLPSELLKEVDVGDSVLVPKTWFDHFRLSVAPNFLVRWFPIKMAKKCMYKKVKLTAIYPKLPLVFPKNGGIRYLCQTLDSL